MSSFYGKANDMLAKELLASSDNISTERVRKADYDRTYIGWVSQKTEVSDTTDKYIWRIQTNGTAYDVSSDNCNITKVGQKVRLYVPNHDYKYKYAEVIEEDNNSYTHPIKAVFNDDNNTITETWKISDENSVTRVYKLTIVNEGKENEEVTEITYPDGSKLSLEGFVIG